MLYKVQLHLKLQKIIAPWCAIKPQAGVMDKMITSLSRPIVPRAFSAAIASLSLAEYNITVAQAFVAEATLSTL